MMSERILKQGVITVLTTRGYGFILEDGESRESIFFHANALKNVTFQDLREGDPVSFYKLVDSNNRSKAVTISTFENNRGEENE